VRPPHDAAGIRPPWSRFLSHPLPGDHVVQLYREERGLVDAVALFAGAGLLEGDAFILVGTPPHVKAVSGRLAGAGFDVDAARLWAQLWVVDAATLLSRLMSNGLPDKGAFDAIVGEALHRAGAGRRRVRVFGEMVDLLWKENLPAAIRLEELWNAAIVSHPISLLCSYCVDGLAESDARSSPIFPLPLHRAHSQQIPLEAWA
jgi:MEDS: MEthanogen/methylotroph, DcmR Sensory domain